jgi:hypothetical protein
LQLTTRFNFSLSLCCCCHCTFLSRYIHSLLPTQLWLLDNFLTIYCTCIWGTFICTMLWLSPMAVARWRQRRRQNSNSNNNNNYQTTVINIFSVYQRKNIFARIRQAKLAITTTRTKTFTKLNVEPRVLLVRWNSVYDIVHEKTTNFCAAQKKIVCIATQYFFFSSLLHLLAHK